MSIENNLTELVKAEVISQNTASDIQAYYELKKSNSGNKLFIAFGILGALLVGLGIILIIAHNWDDLSKFIKTVFAFIPLVIGQFVCGYAIVKDKDSKVLRESGASFLFFGIGASIALVSQIYHIPGGTGTFLLTWMLLCLPIIYLVRSSFISLLYICGITYYACSIGYWEYPYGEPYLYWVLFVLIMPYYFKFLKGSKESNFLVFHNWFIPLSVISVFGTLADSHEEVMYLGFMSLFGFFYLIGNQEYFLNQKLRNSGYNIIGTLGIIVLLLTLSFDWFWERMIRHELKEGLSSSPEMIATALLFIFSVFLLIKNKRDTNILQIKPLDIMFIIFSVVFCIGFYSTSLAIVLDNLLVLSLAIWYVIQGARSNHLAILNFGMITIAVLVTCRFFDRDLTFVVRGVLFIVVGVGFFTANYLMLKKRKSLE
jgi:uncharacterized membrane protein